MRKTRNKPSAEFKAKVELSWIRGTESLSELSSKYVVNANMISRWEKQALMCLAEIFLGKHERSEVCNDQQIKMLHAKIGQLTVEKDFLEYVSKRLGLK
jgi:transposase